MLTRRLNHTCLGLVSGLLLLVGCETDVTNLGQRLGDGGAVGQAGAAAFAGSCAGSCGGSPGACGDGVLQVELGEECDDGNTVETDACTSDCRIRVEATCGDGTLDAVEVCDDANAIAGDGCAADCTMVEDGYVCPVVGEPCVLAETCGDGVVQVELGEECDDGNAVETDACTSDCRALLVVICGDGKLGAGEPCDDANVIDGDGCSADCTEVEEGYVCPVPGQPCVLSPVCGNGIIEGGEACDDGNAEDGDGCAGDCLSLE